MSHNLASVFQEFIPEVIPSQKYLINTVLSFSSYGDANLELQGLFSHEIVSFSLSV
jgi:hypothetical protein